jgi:hypothetical protein
MAMTAPGMRPASISAFKVTPIRASRSLERPTVSGLARGRGSWAKAALEASRQNAVAAMRATSRQAIIVISPFGLLVGPVISGEHYGKVLAEASGVRAQLIDGPARHRLTL